MKKNIVTTITRFGYVNILQVFCFLYISSKISVEDYGLFSLILAISFIVSSALSVGLPISTVFFFDTKANKEKVTRVVFIHTCAVFFFFLLVFCIANLFSFDSDELLYVCVLSFTQYLFQIVCGVIQARNQFFLLNIINALQWSLLSLFLGVLLYSSNDLAKVVTSYTMSSLFCVAIFIVGNKKRLIKSLYTTTFVGYYADARIIYKYGGMSYVNSIISYLNHRLDLLLVNAFLGNLAGGYYSIAIQIAEKISIFSQAICTVIFPAMCREEDKAVRIGMAKKYALLVQLAVIPVVILVYMFGGAFLNFIFNDKFEKSVELINILIIGVVFASSSRLLFACLSANGELTKNGIIGLVTFLSNMVLSVTLILIFDAVGVAIATVFSYGVSLVLAIYFLRKL
jgi:O-antigen/teichoic acid export membrane protein